MKDILCVRACTYTHIHKKNHVANSNKLYGVMFPYQMFNSYIQRKTKAMVGLIWLRIGTRFRLLQTHHKPSHYIIGKEFLNYFNN